MQKTATVEETLGTNKAFQQYALDEGVVINAYHTDNGIIRAIKWQ